MDLNQSIICCEPPVPRLAPVSTVMGKLRTRYGKLGDADPTRALLSYGSLKIERLEESAIAILPLSPWALLPMGKALPQAIIDTHVSTAPVILVFANTHWRLLIASKTVVLPDLKDGGSFGAVAPMSMRILQARLFAQPPAKLMLLRAWHAQVALNDDEALLMFLSTAVLQSLPIFIEPSADYLSEMLHDEYIPEGPEENE